MWLENVEKEIQMCNQPKLGVWWQHNQRWKTEDEHWQRCNSQLINQIQIIPLVLIQLQFNLGSVFRFTVRLKSY